MKSPGKISVPLSDEEFSNSFQTELPRDDIASLHRLFFMGNINNWSSMESRLNAQNKGLTFDAQETIDWIKTLNGRKYLMKDLFYVELVPLRNLSAKLIKNFQQLQI